jgi:hypothetical protein
LVSFQNFLLRGKLTEERRTMTRVPAGAKIIYNP